LILGLTATISAKDANEKKESIDKNLVGICSRLGCKTISTVCNPDNISEINREISRPTNDQFQYVSTVQYNSYFDEYLNMFKELIKLIKRHLDNQEILDGHELGSSGFIGQLVLLKQTFERKDDVNDVIICDYLLLLTKKYSALKDLPFDMVLNYILQKMNEYYKAYKESQPMNNLLHERCTKELKIILEKHAENPTTNSKLNHLVHLLKQYAPNDKKGNWFCVSFFVQMAAFLIVGLILVKTTFYAKTLDDYFRHHPELTVRCYIYIYLLI
jgi:ERCC4-related helicase